MWQKLKYIIFKKKSDLNKASGRDGTTVINLKTINSIVSQVIIELIIQVYYEDKCPNSLKLANVI